MLTRREFLGSEFYAWLQTTYDELRRELKSQHGKPDAVTIELLRLNREYAATLKRMLGP